MRRSLDTLAQFDGDRAAGQLGLGLVAALREHHGEHGLLGIAELVAVPGLVPYFNVRREAVRHAAGLPVLVREAGPHHVEAPVVGVFLAFGHTDRTHVLLDLLSIVFVELGALQHDAGGVFPVGLLADQGDVHIRIEVAEQSFRGGGAARTDDRIDLLQADVGPVRAELIVLASGIEAVLGREIGVGVPAVGSEVLGQVRVVNLRGEDVTGLDGCFGSKHRGEELLGHRESAAVVAQVQDQLGYARLLETLAGGDQVFIRIHGETRIHQVSDFLAVAVEDLGQQDRILVHLLGGDRLGRTVAKHRRKLVAGEQVGIDLGVVARRHGLAVDLEDDVSALQARLDRRAVRIGIGHHGTDRRLVVVGKREIEPVRLLVARHAAVEAAEIVRQHGPAVDILALGVLVTDLLHLVDRLVRLLPGIEVLADLGVPQVVCVHVGMGEGIDVQTCFLRVHFLLGEDGIGIRFGIGGGLLVAAGQTEPQRQQGRKDQVFFHNSQI